MVAIGSERAPASGRAPASELLSQFAHGCDREWVTLGELMAVLEDRSYGVLVAVLAFPNIVPTPIPGLSGALGVPLALVGAQLMLGRRRPWLPRWVTDRAMSRSVVVTVVDRMRPPLERLERLLRPRLPLLTAWTAERLVGGFVLVLAVVLALPIPLGNTLPALALSVIGLGLVERDGLFIAIGTLVGLASLGVVGAVVLSLVQAFLFFLREVFT